MARFNKAQSDQYVDQQNAAKLTAITAITSAVDGGGNNTAEVVRTALNALADIEAVTAKELNRQSLAVNPAVGTMYLEGSSRDANDDPDKVFEMVLLRAPTPLDGPDPNGTGIIIDGEPTGFQLIPLVTGNDTSIAWPSPSGFYLPSKPFDGVSEVFGGSGATDNMLGITNTGTHEVLASCKPSSSQTNREVEIDLIVFDASGTPIRALGFSTEAIQSNQGRAITLVTGRVMLNDLFFTAGQYVGVGIRKGVSEGNTVVTIDKCFVQVSLSAIES